tara:strand:+ start:1964 stop:2137 length:174 start_codon:yes stop_codon:yes gene_type:complete
MTKMKKLETELNSLTEKIDRLKSGSRPIRPETFERILSLEARADALDEKIYTMEIER